MPFKDIVSNEPKLLKIHYSDTHHKWVYYREEFLRSMAKLKGYIEIEKMHPCDACVTVKDETKPIFKISYPSKKATEVG